MSAPLIVDGGWLCCSTWWASPSETSERFGRAVARVAEQVGAQEPPIVAWDSPTSWRRELMPSYKSHRKPKPEALTLALIACRRLPQMRHLQVEGYEADDVLATLARGHDGKVFILTADKDLCMVVSESVVLVNVQGEITDAAAVQRRWGVPPSEMRLLLSWMGDASDGLPGVRGVGPKKAIPHALAGEIGDEMTYELAGLATVPDALLKGGS